MCGRFALRTDIADVIQHYSLTRNVVLKPRYNIAPGQVIPVIRTAGLLEFLIWGLKPKWLKEDQTPFINARMETLAEKQAFRQAFKHQRCLIVADGYYEWKLVGKIKQPYFINFPSQKPIAFAGLWDADTCAIITKPAEQSVLLDIHDRMPVILNPSNYAAWLDKKTNVELIQTCMLNAVEQLQSTPVSTKVNNPQYDFAECIRALQ